MSLDNPIQRAVERLRAGGVVAFPTETVYGLGADAANPEAVARVFAIKGRPAHHPLIVHLGDASLLDHWAREIPPAASRLAERFWPGPLTLILRRGRTPPEVTGGQDSVGLRVPNHPVALELLRGFGGGIAAPSANRFGRVSPTRAEHVREEFGAKVDLILEGGDCPVGLESTILSLIGKQPVLLRPGAISRAELEAVIGTPVAATPARATVRAPGMLESHYAPTTRLRLCAPDRLLDQVGRLVGCGLRIAVMTRILHADDLPTGAHPHPMPLTPADYARRLYASLRQLDSGGFDRIVVEQPPDDESWQAINDRLGRASHSDETG